ncbi:hypothetical protein BST63_03715 [Bradyrhizobium canariense]|uniref:Uncharacterized protein n=1 Tax=Bradyrhizobium canariense TaxID=255045 RepID=A0ABX3XB20_9BRAD|nr:hypothetical protein BST63_03715 [Bradyrhizobium canariense]
MEASPTSPLTAASVLELPETQAGARALNENRTAQARAIAAKLGLAGAASAIRQETASPHHVIGCERVGLAQVDFRHVDRITLPALR